MKTFILIVSIITVGITFLTGCSVQSTEEKSDTTTPSISQGSSTQDNSVSPDTPKQDHTPSPQDTSSDQDSVQAVTSPQKIDPESAKELMDSAANVIILDVRTEEEYKEGHISGSILIPDYELEEKATDQLSDKSATILVYCRSGRRSALAAQTLHQLGYTSIYDFGGILDWPYELTTK